MTERPRRCVPLALIALVLLAGAGSAQATSIKPLKFSSAAADGTLYLSASVEQQGIAVHADGELRVKRKGVRLVVLRCTNRACRQTSERGRSSQLLARSEERMHVQLRVASAASVSVQIRRHGKVLAKWVLNPSSQATPFIKPGPTALSVITSPPLTPAYDPAISDYTVRCNPSVPVSIDLQIPHDGRARINGVLQTTPSSLTDVLLTSGQRMTISTTVAGATHNATVRCLPVDFPTWTVQRDGQAQNPFIVFSPSLGGGTPYTVIADDNGVPIWWMHAPIGTPLDAKIIDDSILWTRNIGAFSTDTSYDRFGLDGSPQSSIVAQDVYGLDQHDLIPDGGDGWYGIAYVPRDHVDLTALAGPNDAYVFESQIVHLDATGTVDWRWKSQDHIATDETASWGDASSVLSTYHGQPAYDLVHMNSIELDGDGVVFSARHLNAVYRIKLSDGTIDWKLGGSPRPESLTVVGDPFGSTSFGGQHDARIGGDGSLTLHDNGTRRNRAPRALRYTLDSGAGTATLVEQVTDSRVPASFCCGSARRLAGGNWLMSWGGNSVVTELTPDGRSVLTLTFPAPAFSYRAVPWQGPAGGVAELRQAMDAVAERALAG
ncbi:MAG: aryl-sulfate sulfotransferase [Thermoleophilaceae bacterium]|nr:aryl-sulfate sulfotransferase [Thermoleophilaceae bacterium]